MVDKIDTELILEYPSEEQYKVQIIGNRERIKIYQKITNYGAEKWDCRLSYPNVKFDQNILDMEENEILELSKHMLDDLAIEDFTTEVVSVTKK